MTGIEQIKLNETKVDFNGPVPYDSFYNTYLDLLGRLINRTQGQY
jgi:hypothetical protein